MRQKKITIQEDIRREIVIFICLFYMYKLYTRVFQFQLYCKKKESD